MSTNRSDVLKASLFSNIPTRDVVEEINFQNGTIEDSPDEEGMIAPKSQKAGALAIAFGSVTGSKDFPLRSGNANPRGLIAPDGSLIYFLWPSERGDARGYIKPAGELELSRIVFRLRMGRPEPPYYLRWRKGDYYLYTPPGALVKRASTLIAGAMLTQGYELMHVQALSDMRMAILINLAFRGKGQDIMDELAELDARVRQDVGGLRKYWQEYKELLTRSHN